MNVFERDRERFKRHLALSDESVWFVARYFSDSGWSIMMHPHSAFGSYEERMKEVDHGDLYIRKRADKAWCRIEVKHRNLAFTNERDFPYPTIFVCSRHAWDNADPKPNLIIYTNKSLTHFAFHNPRKTQDDWRLTTVDDSRYESSHQQTYEIDSSLLRYRSFSNLWPSSPGDG